MPVTMRKSLLSQPSNKKLGDFNPELCVEKTGRVFKAYKRELAVRERDENRKTEDVDQKTLKELKSKSYIYF